ncbi:MAG TPA: nucleotide sugar dehydrogenase [Acidimicrobiales bacterium]|nr:nucleotide sugar dehydrogenase [Acidimicrobiales bacterium]
MSRIAVIGTGYVGLTTGAYLAHIGHDVTCADVVEDKVIALSRGEVPIHEPGLPEMVQGGLSTGKLRFVVGSADAVAAAEFVFLCLPTPQGHDGAADMSYIRDEAERIGPLLAPGAVVVNKSTVPVGSTRMVQRVLNRGDVLVVSNPEFLREGSALHDSLNPDRIVIGADDPAAASRVAALYEQIKAPVLVTDPASAELIKYASNAFLATKISYINAIANLCEAVGADVREVVLGMGYDKRIGFEFLRPGPGWGGSCFHPDETLLVRRGDEVRLLSFAELFAEVDEHGTDGWEALSWDPCGVSAEFCPISTFTRRWYSGDMVEVRTKMGRRLRTTVDHPFVVGDGSGRATARVLAGDLTTGDWLPIAQRAPAPMWDASIGLPLTATAAAGIQPHQVIVRCGRELAGALARRSSELPPSRRRDILRCNALRLHELAALGIDVGDPLAVAPAGLSTVTNGTYVPSHLELDEAFWRVIGLYLAEGSITRDKDRQRICWHFHPTDEADLVECVRAYWATLGVKATVARATTSQIVRVSSRVLAAWFEHGLRLGRDCYTKQVPDLIWGAPPESKAALLRGLWDGDGSWSLVAGGPSVVLDYGTVSPRLADGMLRLLGDLEVCARLKTGRSRKSTTDTFWIRISGAEQIENALWLFPEAEREQIAASIGTQAKRIAPTGYRRSKNAAWARVVRVAREHYEGPVYSVELPATHTVVATNGLVASNCLPKDTRALVRIADDAGYDFGLLEGVIEVNDEQYERMVLKVRAALGGRLEGRSLAVWGLTFKAMTDDLRDSPALAVVGRLREAGATVRAYDPMVRADRAPAGVEVGDDPYAVCAGADAVVLLTEWDEFRWLDFDKVHGLLAQPVLVDCRNLLDPAAMRRRGFTYSGVGRP